MSSNVYTGLWIDWDRGPISGATLTTSSQSGLYLIAFLSLFVRAVGGHFWSILTYFIHQLRCRKEALDTIHYQKQALTRNSESATGYLWSLIIFSWSWKKKGGNVFKRTIPLAAIAVIQIATFAVAAFFSSQIASTNRQVLIDNLDRCGYFGYNVSHIDFMVSSRRTAEWALNHARECYKDESFNSICNMFVGGNLDLLTRSVDCPFEDPAICMPIPEKAWQVDTGLLDSARHFGINSPAEHGFKYRKVTTCSPIERDGFVSDFKNNGQYPKYLDDETVYELQYGREVREGGNATFAYTMTDWLAATRAYYLDHQTAYAKASGEDRSSDFVPIPQLQVPDADVTLIMLLNSAEYTEPVNDSWFRAQTPTEPTADPQAQDNALQPDMSRFYADPPANVMGCVVQHQVCSSPTSCSPLMGLSHLKEYDFAPNDPMSSTIWTFFLRAASNAGLDYTIATLGDAVLQAYNSLTYAQRLRSAPLPDLQWQTEVVGWVQFSLSNIQRLLYDFANGPSDPALSAFMVAPPNRDIFDVCASQKIKNPAFYCFSVVGLGVTLLGGMTVIVVNLGLATCVGFVQRRTGKGAYRAKQWTEDSVLQIQRLAYQNLGVGHCEGCDDSVPTTDARLVVGRPTRIWSDVPTYAKGDNASLMALSADSQFAVLRRDGYTQVSQGSGQEQGLMQQMTGRPPYM